MRNITINVVGDFILSRRMHRVYEDETAKQILNDSYDIFQQADLNICNLETVITNKGTPYPKGEKNPYYFRCSTRLAKLLVDSNIHAVTTGNNHAMDYGPVGIEFQNKFLDQLNIPHPGSGSNLEQAKKVAYLEVNELVIALISFSSVKPKTLNATTEKAGVFYISPISSITTELADIVKQAKAKADIVIVSPHWTENWETEPEAEHRKQAKMLIDLGCDAVLGHSSHLLMGMEIYKEKPIVYDMGTFLVDTIAGHQDLKYSGLFQLQVENKCITKMNVFPVKLSNGHVHLAEGSDREKVFNKVLSLGVTESRVNFFEECLTIDLMPTPKPIAIKDNKDLTRVTRHPSPQNNISLFTQKPDVVMDIKPEWCNRFLPIEMENGYTFLGFHTVESFRAGSGFLLFVAFRVGRLQASENYEIEIVGESDYGSTFKYLHPLSNGVYNSLFWQQDEILKDEVNVRVNRRVDPGRYKLYFGIKNVDTEQYIKTLGGDDHLLFSDIYILPELISNLASGIDWNGQLPADVKKKFKVEFMENPEQNLFAGVRKSLMGENGFDKNFSFRAIELKYQFNKSVSLIYLTLFQEKTGWVRWGSRRPQLKQALQRNIEKISVKKGFSNYDVMNSEKSGMLIEMVIEKKEHDIQQLLLDEYLYQQNGLGFEFILDGKVDDLYTSSECRYYNLYTNRQKIAFALISRGINDFDDLKQYIDKHSENITFNHVTSIALLDYQDKTTVYNGESTIDSLLFS
ncbi:MAG: CapA family protein [Methylococcaceae bacterium]